VWSTGVLGKVHLTFEQIIEYLSQEQTLQPGDLLGSGTVGRGCGLEMDRWLPQGSTVELEAEGIGILRNRVGQRQSHKSVLVRSANHGGATGWPDGRRASVEGISLSETPLRIAGSTDATTSMEGTSRHGRGGRLLTGENASEGGQAPDRRRSRILTRRCGDEKVVSRERRISERFISCSASYR
jgi:hypothetical protein